MFESRPIRILIADDHALMRSALHVLFGAAPDIEVVGEAGDGEEAESLAAQLLPDLVLIDLDMPGEGGLEATRHITTHQPDTRVLVLTALDAEDHLLAVVDAGASGYVLKQTTDTDLIAAIHAVHAGEVYFYPSAVKVLLEAYRRSEPPSVVEEPLTETEEQVLRLTAAGYSNTEIGRQLSYSPKTIDFYRVRVMRKLGLHHRTELVRYALRHGLLRAD